MGKEAYKISVIVTVYNKESYLRECVDSILGQTCHNLELLLVDDESTDSSGKLCDDYQAADGRVRVIHQKNGGPTSACVAGMNAATGDYYMFVDSDDYIEKETLEEMAACLKGQKGELVCCNHMAEKQKSTEPVYNAAAPGVYTGEKLQKQIKDKLLGKAQKALPTSRCMKLCEKSIFQGNEIYYDYSVRYGEDILMMYPALLNSTRVVIMKEALYYHYRYVGDSMIHQYDAGMYESMDVLMKAMLRAALDKKVSNAERMVNRERCYMLIQILKNELRNPDKNYQAKIRDIFRDKAVREMILTTPIEIRERTEALLYLGMRYPDKGLMAVLRLLFKMYDRRK